MIQKLRELMRASPFKPFYISLADGRRFPVPSPDMVWLAAGGRGGLHIFEPVEDIIISVNPMLISSIEFGSESLRVNEDQ